MLMTLDGLLLSERPPSSEAIRGYKPKFQLSHISINLIMCIGSGRDARDISPPISRCWYTNG